MFAEFGHHQEQKTRRSGRGWVACVALAGELASSIYTGKDGAPRVGLDLTAHAVLTAYHVTRKRRAVQPQGQPQDSAPPPPEHWPPPDAPFDL